MKLHKNLKQDEIAFVALWNEGIITKQEYRAIMTWSWNRGFYPKRYKVLYRYGLNAIYDTKDILEAYNKYIQSHNICKHKQRYKAITKMINYIKDNK